MHSLAVNVGCVLNRKIQYKLYNSVIDEMALNTFLIEHYISKSLHYFPLDGIYYKEAYNDMMFQFQKGEKLKHICFPG